MGKKNKIFAIGDIHGCAFELEKMLDLLPLTPDCTIVFLGDYIDRGEDSAGVIDIIIELRKEYDVITLKGNHEKMFIDFLNNKYTPDAQSFILNGGGATLASYGDESGNYHVSEEHMAFFESLLVYYQTDDYIFVHAGLPNIPLEELENHPNEAHFLWIREPFLLGNYEWSKTVIHGHTKSREPFMSKRRINLDTGCAYGGKLTALELPELKLYHVPKEKQTKHIHLRDKSSQRRSMRFNESIPVYITKPKQFPDFQTVNFSEFGMLIYNRTPSVNPEFKEGEIIAGQIGDNTLQPVYFEGRIIRVNQKSVGIFYAISFTKKPFDFNIE